VCDWSTVDPKKDRNTAEFSKTMKTDKWPEVAEKDTDDPKKGRNTAKFSKTMKTDKRPEVAKKDGKNNAQKRSLKWDKKRSMKKKKKEKAHNYFRREDQILTSSIPHGMAANKSPHILINLWFSRMKKNTIILKNPIESGKGKCRKVFL